MYIIKIITKHFISLIVIIKNTLDSELLILQ